MTRDSLDDAIADSERLFAEIGAATFDGVGITRPSYGEGERIAHAAIAREGRALGLEVTTDAALNLHLTLKGRDRDAPAIVTGSHLDSAPRGGNFDGLAGVLAGLACARMLREAGGGLACDFTVMAIRAEENAWFGAQHVGSRAALGMLGGEVLDRARRADTGRSLADHMAEEGADLAPIRAGRALLEARRLRAFLEVHIEQGPALVQRDLPFAVVNGIRGTMRCREAICRGEYGHSGTVPRAARRDAVMAVADLAMRIDGHWRAAEMAGEDMVATIGRFSTDPRSHGLTVIPGEVGFCVDARSHERASLERLWSAIRRDIAAIESERGVRFELAPVTADPPVAMDAGLRRLAWTAAAELGLEGCDLASGAGHDAGDFAAAGVPSAMIFIRNENGSHNPAESMRIDDYAIAVRLLARMVETLGDR